MTMFSFVSPSTSSFSIIFACGTVVHNINVHSLSVWLACRANVRGVRVCGVGGLCVWVLNVVFLCPSECGMCFLLPLFVSGMCWAHINLCLLNENACVWEFNSCTLKCLTMWLLCCYRSLHEGSHASTQVYQCACLICVCWLQMHVHDGAVVKSIMFDASVYHVLLVLLVLLVARVVCIVLSCLVWSCLVLCIMWMQAWRLLSSVWLVWLPNTSVCSVVVQWEWPWEFEHLRFGSDFANLCRIALKVCIR